MSKDLSANYAFIDGQNLHMGTTRAHIPWSIDLARFRVYLKEKYFVGEAYYFLGFINESNQNLYAEVQKAGFILKFKEHNSAMLGLKKGNVDTDIVFNVMKLMYQIKTLQKVVLVSGDGDYKLLVDFLLEIDRLEKVLFPDGSRASSLYKKITRKYFDDLSNKSVRKKIEKREKEKGALGN